MRSNDIFEAFDAGESVLLVALDQSAAFDCIDHHTLLDRLRHTHMAWQVPYLIGYNPTSARINHLSNGDPTLPTALLSTLGYHKDQHSDLDCFPCT